MFLMLFITIAVFTFIGNNVTHHTAEDVVVELVSDNTKNIKYSRGKFNFTDIVVYNNGAFFSVYNDDLKLVAGSVPRGFNSSEVPFHNAVVSTARQGDMDYFVYDREWTIATHRLLLRGVIPATITHGVVLNSLIVVLIWLLLAIFIGIYGADYISKRIFKPIKTLIEEAATISSGDKLSERISIARSSDEVRELADTFNDMFERLEDSFESQKRFVSDASHELRTPTTIILAECARAKKKARTNEDFIASLTNIEEQSNKMAHMISQLLSITRLDQGTAHMRMQEADFSAFLTVCCDEFVPANDRGITLTMQIEPHIYLAFDPGLMVRVIQNLLENAYKYGRDNGNIIVALKRHKSSASLFVIDDGIGISKEDQQYIFKRFWQADPSRGEDLGVGLGLSMVKQICEFHGGNITVISNLNEGSSFIVTLPAKQQTNK